MYILPISRLSLTHKKNKYILLSYEIMSEQGFLQEDVADKERR